MNTYRAFIIVGLAAVVIIGVIVTLEISKVSIATQDYEIFVDPLKDEQNMFVMGRVTIQNIGAKPLTNIKVNFGGGDTLQLGS